MRTGMYIAGIIGLLSLSEVCASDLSFCVGRDSVAIRTQNQNVTAQEKETPICDLTIIDRAMVEYFAKKESVKVEVSVEDASGRGDRAVDFFMIEPKGNVRNIPTTLDEILQKSEFLKIAINALFNSGSEVLKISEALSDPSSRGAINGFIGITQKDLPLSGFVWEGKS